MIRRVAWATGTYDWNDDSDAAVLDPRTAAVLAFGEAQLAHSILLRSGRFTRQELAESTLRLYDAKRRAIAILDG